MALYYSDPVSWLSRIPFTARSGMTLYYSHTRAAIAALFVSAEGYDSRRLVMVTSSREGTMMPLVIPLAMA